MCLRGYSFRITAWIVAVVLHCGCLVEDARSAEPAPSLERVRVLGLHGFQHGGTLSHIAYLSDGKRILSAARDGTARLWDLESGREIRRFTWPESGDTWCVVALPGDREVLTAGEDGYVVRWDLESGKRLMTYKHESTAFRIALHPNGKEFVSTDSKKLAILWNLKTGKQVRVFKGHKDSVYTAAFVLGGKRLITGGDGGVVNLWDVATGKVLNSLDEKLEDVFTLALSPDGKRVLACCGDKTLRMLDAASLKQVWKKTLPDDANVADWSPDGLRIAAACEDKLLYILDAGDGATKETITVPGGSHTPVAFSPDGSELLSGGDQIIYRHEIETKKRRLPTLGAPYLLGEIGAVGVSADGQAVCATGEGSRVEAWDAGTGKSILRHVHGCDVESVAVSPDGGRIAVGGENGATSILDARNGGAAKDFNLGNSVDCLVFDATGKRLVAGGSKDEGRVWDAATGRQLAAMKGHTGDINAFAISPDGRQVLTVSDDKTARVWDSKSGKELRRLGPVKEALHHAVWLADGRSFLVAPRDKGVWGWLAPRVDRSPGMPPEKVRGLVADLTADDFPLRANATRQLVDAGPGILPVLDALELEDVEGAYRLAQVRLSIARVRKGGDLKALHSFPERVEAMTGHPSGRYWAAILGSEQSARLVLGEMREGKLQVLQTVVDGGAPNSLAFSADGQTLVTGNDDGTVGVYRVRAP